MNEEILIEDTVQPKKKRTRLVAEKRTGFQCSFCGNYTTGINEYYSSLTTILLTRFINLLNSNNGQNYFDGMLDCIHAVFGRVNPAMRRALKLAEYLDAFEQRHGKADEEIKYKLQCQYCKEWKDEWEITLDDSLVKRLICEDCLSKQQENKSSR